MYVCSTVCPAFLKSARVNVIFRLGQIFKKMIDAYKSGNVR